MNKSVLTNMGYHFTVDGENFFIGPETMDWDTGMPTTPGPGFKSKAQHPYNYDPIVIFHGGEQRSDNSFYTDRLLQWDWDKHNRISMEIWGDEAQTRWSDRELGEIELFVRKWCENDSLILNSVVEMCNSSNGYPVWLIGWIDPNKES